MDGIAFAQKGPILLHIYDPPAGGKWIDDVIPGKLAALDRNSGESLWLHPCEVGYGRGFGAAISPRGEALVLGPASGGHRIVRMALSNGELVDSASIPAFDEAHVSGDLCLCASAGRVCALDALGMVEAWEHRVEGERYHLIGRSGDRAVVAFTDAAKSGQGLMRLDAETGELDGLIVLPSLPVIHYLALTSDVVVILTSELGSCLAGDVADAFEREVALLGGTGRDTLSLAAFRLDGEVGADPLWYRVLDTQAIDDLPEASISADSGKLYLVRGTHLEALDALSGRALGEWTVPGLDEKVAWTVVEGAGLLAEETRVSLFELPA